MLGRLEEHTLDPGFQKAHALEHRAGVDMCAKNTSLLGASSSTALMHTSLLTAREYMHSNIQLQRLENAGLLPAALPVALKAYCRLRPKLAMRSLHLQCSAQRRRGFLSHSLKLLSLQPLLLQVE
jgi:hypothetical protein